MKHVLLAAAFAALTSTATSAGPVRVERGSYASVKLVRCGPALGTAFQVAPGVLMTAAHVTRNGSCSIDGVPVATMTEDRKLDYALLSGSVGAPMALKCAELKRGRTYYAIGYAGGVYRMDSRLFAVGRTEADVEGIKYDGMILFRGGVIPGMSGGAIVDQAGRVVAIINASNAAQTTALGRSIKDTILC